jgi:uncharacterized protein (UPF0371 family)
VSDEGYGANAYIETDKPIVVVTGPAPEAANLPLPWEISITNIEKATERLCQIRNFSVWDLPLDHLVNTAYEAATADLRDVNMIDPYHLKAYGKIVVNYNRDIEAFGLLKKILEKITEGASVYQSPTDMVLIASVQVLSTTKCAKKQLTRKLFVVIYKVLSNMLWDEQVRIRWNVQRKSCAKWGQKTKTGGLLNRHEMRPKKPKGVAKVMQAFIVALPSNCTTEPS